MGLPPHYGTYDYDAPEQRGAAQKGEPRDIRWKDHTEFAEEVLGECDYLRGASAAPEKAIMHGLAIHTRGHRWIFGVWTCEVVWMVFLAMACGLEVWSACPFDIGLMSVCRNCFGATFLIWSCTLLVVWFAQIVLHVLIISGGLTCAGLLEILWLSLRRKRDALNNMLVEVHVTRGGILSLKICADTALLILAIVGVVHLLGSGACPPPVHGLIGRSSLMFTSVRATVIALPVFLGLGSLASV
mmetsp:Transcript_3729/g.7389  ORF Transcript_3729/g.7389 Transcript_3729/m.7389 type:complete len:243 (-) Transcript_3729:76-804(-)|eukprot:CAMPEP_0172717698 /NCGR_PEP_ID=MMETSP1074-20121228/72255_1 /TAXON_ID=2916 /ORGANISM="Ceratium fusus, Strain PA161109" /LENGTH=242 /DNA_ID=CAMNT_0013542701 /DNA_START=100 /DNA_END=828 /DNA_ORIENTATION=-